MNLYEFWVNGKTWKDPEEQYLIESDNPYNALTKLRILHGNDTYERAYGCYDCENQEMVRELYSYTMLREQRYRRLGRKYVMTRRVR